MLVEYFQTASIGLAWPGGTGSSGRCSGKSGSNGNYASGFGEEDLRSNHFGILFSNGWDRKVPLCEALEKYFRRIGVIDPPKAELDKLPEDEVDWQ